MPRKNNSRRASGEGNIRQRKNGIWEARYTLGTNPGTGKPIRKSVYGSTQAEALKKLKQIQSSIDSGSYLEPIKITVAGWMNIWFKEYLGAVKSSTAYSYGRHIKNYINPYLGAVRLQKLTSPAVQKFYNEKLNSGLSPKTIKNLHGVLHSALKQAVLIGYLKSNPTEACKLPRIEKKEISVMNETELATFLNEIKGHKFETLFFFAAFTGMRKGEILGLTWDCINFSNNTIIVNKQLQRESKIGGKYKFMSLKNDKSRKIIVADTLISRLKAHKKQQIESQLKCGTLWNNTDNLVFTNEVGSHLNHYTVWKHFKKIVRKLGLEHIRFHDLRHSYAVTAIQCGDDIKTIQETLGHHTAAFTLDTYGHVAETMKQKSAKRMDNFINSLIV